ncbi:hypothetical protein ILYODFUR_006814 [Ilyodon furcidens]|uniref:Cadherin domain-containing protein n=1 Tax=Ilyodon furcidens TaxID=33524 RepID=A0ABV0SJ34_9TELE
MGTFDVEPEVGTIFVAQPLDYEMEQRYELRLVASDGKWENETLVVVQVVNRNDEAPVFSQTEYHSSVMEELTQLPVFILEVSGCVGLFDLGLSHGHYRGILLKSSFRAFSAYLRKIKVLCCICTSPLYVIIVLLKNKTLFKEEMFLKFSLHSSHAD